MRFRKLRIAWSVVWGIVAVMLIVLWVRGYSGHADITWIVDGDLELSVTHHSGTVWLAHRRINPYPMGGGFVQENPMPLLKAPYWFLVLVVAMFSSLPWLTWRFSLRTLLIVTTLVAVVLGLVVYAARN